MSESKIEQAACSKILQKFGIQNVKFTPKQSTGFPDRIFWIPGGKPLLIEFKKPGEEPKPKQDRIIEELRTLGYDVAVCDSIEGAVAAVRKSISKLTSTKK